MNTGKVLARKLQAFCEIIFTKAHSLQDSLHTQLNIFISNTIFSCQSHVHLLFTVINILAPKSLKITAAVSLNFHFKFCVPYGGIPESCSVALANLCNCSWLS